MIYVISIIVIIILLELLIRTVIKKAEQNRIEKERQNVLDESMRQDFSKLSYSLKRVELQNPLARMLVIDKDEQILGKLRNMMVIDGYSVDTVTSGKEALELIMFNHYDFVFTGERSKDLSGKEISEKVLEKRKDMNIVVITESIADATPYDLIREGAIDFIQKPHVDSRLKDFVRTQIKERRQRIEEELIHSAQSNEAFTPKGIFITPCHLWIHIEQNGNIKIGIDKFASDFLGVIDTIDFANLNIQIDKGNPLFIVKKNFRDMKFCSPFTGRVIGANTKLRNNLGKIYNDPYSNWILLLEPTNLDETIKFLMIGKAGEEFLADQKASLVEALDDKGIKFEEYGRHLDKFDDNLWNEFSDKFFVNSRK